MAQTKGPIYFGTEILQETHVDFIAWICPDYARLHDGTFASISPDGVSGTQDLLCNLGDVELPNDAIVSGIQVSMFCRQATTAGEFGIEPLSDGNGAYYGVSPPHQWISTPNAWQILTFGSPNDFFQLGLTKRVGSWWNSGSAFLNPFASYALADKMDIDWIQIQVWYDIGQGRYPTAGSSLGSGHAWCNASNIDVWNGTYASCRAVGTSPQQTLWIIGFEFSIPATAKIDGIVVEIIKLYDGRSNGQVVDSCIQLIARGLAQGINKASPSVWPTQAQWTTYGSPTDLWGNSLTASDINDSANFGVAIQVKGTTDATVCVANIDRISLIVYYTDILGSGRSLSFAGRSETIDSSEY